MNIKQILDTDTIVLEEGLIFFKESKKISRTIHELEKKISKLHNKALYAPMKTLLTKLKKLQVKFEEVESSVKDKKLSRGKFNNLKQQHKELLKIVNDYEIKRTLKKLGLYLLFATAAVAFGSIISEITNKHHDLITSADYKDKTFDAYHPKTKDTSYMHTIADVGSSKPSTSTSHQDAGIGMPSVTIKPQHIVAEICTKENVPYEVINAIIKKESSWDPKALGVNPSSKDVGLMQLNSKYLDYYIEKFWKEKRRFDPNDVRDNVTLGVRYFKYLAKLFHGDMNKALMAYNAGPTAVAKGIIPDSSKRYAYSIMKTLTTKTV